MYVTDSQGTAYPISGGTITDISINSPNNTISISKAGNVFSLDVIGGSGEANIINSITFNGDVLPVVSKNVSFEAVEGITGTLVDNTDPYNPVISFNPADYSLDEFVNPSLDPFLRASDLINDHNNLTGLQGGKPLERYHLTESEHSYLTEIVSDDTIGLILDAIVVHPIYVAPVSNLSALPLTAEQGSPVPINITQTFTQNDAGTKVSETIKKDGLTVSTTSSFIETLTLNSATVYSGTVTYADGVIKNNNLNQPDATGRILAGTVNSPSKTITPLLPFFYGVFNTVQNLSTLALTGLSKTVADSNSTITANVNAVDQFIVIAIPNSSTIKTKWYVNDLNQGNIGGATNLFSDSVTSPKNSPDGYWGGITYRLYQTNYKTTTSSIQLRN